MSFLTVLGFGNVGQTLCKQAINTGLKVLAVADSSGAVVSQSSSGLNTEKINQLSVFKQNGKLSNWNGDEEKTLSLNELCVQLPQDSVVADCTATNETTKYLQLCQQRNIAITMANKKPLTGPYSDFTQFTANTRLIRFECTVGAGLPVIGSLRRLIDSGDKIIQIQGQLSGTLGFILSELQSGKASFSEIVRKAKDAGFTEPDPRDDLSGIDVARKSLILARCMGIKMELNEIEVDCLYPKEMESLSVDEFMQNIKSLDGEMGKRIANATQNGNRLRYAAVVTKESVKVGLVEVAPDNALFNLVGTDNLVSIQTEWYKSPLVVAGPGAGVEVTAAGVLSDVYQLKEAQGQ
eukprot:92182_1